MKNSGTWSSYCPVNITSESAKIQLAHGEGARATRQLIRKLIEPRFSIGSHLADAAWLEHPSEHLAVATDSHTVHPLFFPGGDIGSLSVYGTVNDLAVSGAKARWLTLSLVIEEGLPIAVLECVLDSVAEAAKRCEVSVICGDTKVMPQGAVDGLVLNTTGIGQAMRFIPAGPDTIEPTDCIIVSGPLGQHGIAVMSAREEFSFSAPPVSDSAPLTDSVEALLFAAGDSVRAVRDATRGGVSAVLHEWAESGACSFELKQSQLPVSETVKGACEVLGLDPLYVANEGVFVAAVAKKDAEAAVAALQKLPISREATVVGQAGEPGMTPVTIRRILGAAQPLDEPSGAPLPRIC